jgi:ABC-type lipoprotein release transport system permease subunit
MNGMISQRVDDALNEEISDIQITARDYRTNYDPQLVIRDPEETISKIKLTEGVAGISERIILTGMANTAYKSTGVQIVGIDPEKEKQVLKLYTKLIPGTGDYFNNESKSSPVLIGEDLAKELNIIRYSIDSSTLVRLKARGLPESVMAKLVLLRGKRFTNERQFIKEMKALFAAGESKKYGTVIKKEAWSFRNGARFILTFLDKDNNQVGAAFRITGLYDISNSVFEKSTVFVKNSDLKKLIGLHDNSFHEIVVRISDLDRTESITNTLAVKLSDLEVLSWKKLQPELALMTDMVQQFYLVFGIIILAALAFGIVNTMLMVVLERTKEIGMLTAIGMNKKRIFYMIMLESVFLSLTGGVAGMIISFIVIRITSNTGINLSRYAEGFGAMGYSALIYPRITLGFFGIVTILIVITGVLSSFYPAVKALKLNPVEAIKSE